MSKVVRVDKCCLAKPGEWKHTLILLSCGHFTAFEYDESNESLVNAEYTCQRCIKMGRGTFPVSVPR